MEATTPRKAIRLKCLDCCGNNPYEVRMCPITGCPLYDFRSGKRKKYPDINGDFSEGNESDDDFTADED